MRKKANKVEHMFYDVVYIAMNLFQTYIIFRLMGIFFNREAINRNKECLTYLLYYLCITGIYLLINIPVITLAANLIAFALLSFNYKAGLKQRVLSVSFICLILLCSEGIIVLLTGHINSPIFSRNDYSSVIGTVSIQLFTYMVVLILQNYKNIRKGNNIPTIYWLAIFLIPSASLYIIVNLLMATGLPLIQVLLCIVLVLLVNVATFYLYDFISMEIEEEMTNRMLLQQNNYYERQFALINTALAANKSLRHDWENHLSILYSLSEKNEGKHLMEYLSELMEEKTVKEEYTRSGNVVIDSILNFKLQEAERKGIQINLEVSVPEQLSVKSFDMTVILGNLLDNAIEACCKIAENKRKIRVSIRYDKSRLFIEIKNQYENEILYEKGNIITTNDDKKNHGAGLSNVKNAVEKYQGLLHIEHSDNTFNVTALLFV
ncbi:GHKL domain-containing protein [Anaerocolumna sedimenticola]|uniref:GHKL domain-containing protein n=1 Tax=Anaerocolumna sedimenticola TaxID=2696063 RepID=A0A6P1TGT5_9FIRM|nr:sensor histidine kinase [Anaerocolumna sedimenticola]QHQ59507.1 GHKL domain-containing protein [Anaerocolumna sedimenticola]